MGKSSKHVPPPGPRPERTTRLILQVFASGWKQLEGGRRRLSSLSGTLIGSRGKETKVYIDIDPEGSKVFGEWSEHVDPTTLAPAGAVSPTKTSADASRAVRAIMRERALAFLNEQEGETGADQLSNLVRMLTDAWDDGFETASKYVAIASEPLKVGDYVRTKHFPFEAGEVRAIEDGMVNVITTSGWSRGAPESYTKLVEIKLGEVAQLVRAVDEDAWISKSDKPLPDYDDAIKAAFPTRSNRHDLYAEAARLVGARFSKAGLIALVNMLLHRIENPRGT